jgi:hypothetical protein
MHIQFSENFNVRELGADGMIILKCTLRELSYVSVGWIDLPLNMMNLQVP